MIRFKTALVMGGTGMLAAATQWLLARSEKMLLVARHASLFPFSPGLVPITADWKRASFESTVHAALDGSPPVDVALLWLHEPDPVLGWLLPMLPGARVVLVLGSIDGRPGVPGEAGRVAIVRLGSVGTRNGRRWLTHEEISSGAIASLKDGTNRIVGELTAMG
jgi:hypothetical protein